MFGTASFPERLTNCAGSRMRWQLSGEVVARASRWGSAVGHRSNRDYQSLPLVRGDRVQSTLGVLALVKHEDTEEQKEAA